MPGRSTHKTTAWPLALAWAALIVYASLYPFENWRPLGIAPWTFLSTPLPRYWTGFDVIANLLGYGPLGFLLALSALRSWPRWRAVLLATLAGGLLSLGLEALQNYLPGRVASNVDFALNLAGTWLGALMAFGMEKAGAIDRWSRFRARWFVAESRGALVLLALWPVALLFPAAVPFGLGQVLERAEAGLEVWLADTPFLAWMPVREVELQPLLPGAELLCVMLGALIPCLLAYSIIRGMGHRLVMALSAIGVGLAASGLSAALSYGPSHAWAWLTLPVQVGLLAALLAILALLPLSRRACAAWMVLALVVHLSLLNNAPTGAYFAHTLQAWEQGRFIRFHGLAQWLGWLWPYAALAYLMARVSRREPEN